MAAGAAIPLIVMAVATAAATAYSVYSAQQAASDTSDMYDAQIKAQEDAEKLRRHDRLEQAQRDISEKSALMSGLGITMEGTPSQILASTAGAYEKEQYADTIQTKNNIYAMAMEKRAKVGALQRQGTAALISGAGKFASIGAGGISSAGGAPNYASAGSYSGYAGGAPRFSGQPATGGSLIYNSEYGRLGGGV